MTRHSRISDRDLFSLVEDGGATWRYSALVAAVVHVHRVSPRSARRVVSKAVDRGVIARTGMFYGTPEAVSTTSADNIDLAKPRQPCVPQVVKPNSLLHTSTHRYRRVDQRDLLERLLGRNWRYSELLAMVCGSYGCAESTARRNISHAVRFGYLERGHSGYHVTATAESQLSQYGRLGGLEGMRFARYCSARPGLGLDRQQIRYHRNAPSVDLLEPNVAQPPATRRYPSNPHCRIAPCGA
jgi:hypothetical protein